MTDSIFKRRWLFPAGISLLLTLVVLSFGLFQQRRNENQMARMFEERGMLLIRTLEASTRFGMGHSKGTLRALLEEVVSLSDIHYVVIARPDGKVALMADPEGLAATTLTQNDIELRPSLLTETDTAGHLPSGWQIVGAETTRHFLVQGTFRPVPLRKGTRGHHRMHRGMDRFMERPDIREDSPPPLRLQIYIGMECRHFDTLRKESLKSTGFAVIAMTLFGVVGIFGMFWFRSLRESRAELKDIRALATKVIRSAPTGVIVLEPDETLRYVNEAAATLLSGTLSGMEGTPVRPLLPEALHPLLEAPDRPHEQEIDLGTPEAPVPVSVSTYPIRTDTGIIGTVLAMVDLGPIRRLEAEIRTKEKDAALGKLAAGVAHEIRNPLSSIKGFATHFKERFDSTDPSHEAATVMIEEVDRLDRVISELLDFTRPSDIHPRPTKPGDLIGRAVALIESEALNNQIALATDIRTETAFFLDPDRMIQVLLNLALNGLQAMEKGGHLTLSAMETETALEISVADTGCGIPESSARQIFDPYFTTKPQGTGLGLSVVRKIMDAHDGSIRLSSTSSGTTFVLVLPKG